MRADPGSLYPLPLLHLRLRPPVNTSSNRTSYRLSSTFSPFCILMMTPLKPRGTLNPSLTLTTLSNREKTVPGSTRLLPASWLGRYRRCGLTCITTSHHPVEQGEDCP